MARSKHPWRRLQRNVCIYLKYEYYGYSMDELAEHYGLSHQRISQIVRNVYYREYHGDDEYIAEIDRQTYSFNFIDKPTCIYPNEVISR